MRAALSCLVLATACAPGGASVMNPLSGVLSAPSVPDTQRGAVELAVKSDYDAILTDVARGGGPALTRAFDAAGVPATDRPARVIQLRSDTGLYAASPGALISALLVWGG